MKVELLLYSGRPDPSWHMDDRDDLVGVARRLPAAYEVYEIPDRLGFRGLMAYPDGRASWRSLWVMGERVILQGRRSRGSFVDRGFVLHRLLLKGGSGFLDPGILSHLEAMYLPGEDSDAAGLTDASVSATS